MAMAAVLNPLDANILLTLPPMLNPTPFYKSISENNTRSESMALAAVLNPLDANILSTLPPMLKPTPFYKSISENNTRSESMALAAVLNLLDANIRSTSPPMLNPTPFYKSTSENNTRSESMAMAAVLNPLDANIPINRTTPACNHKTISSHNSQRRRRCPLKEKMNSKEVKELVMEKVKILKRCENLKRNLVKCSGTDWRAVGRRLSVVKKKGVVVDDHRFAGSGFTTAPPPSDLPLPNVNWLRKGDEKVEIGGATDSNTISRFDLLCNANVLIEDQPLDAALRQVKCI